LPSDETAHLLVALDAFLGDLAPQEDAPEEEIDFQPMGVSLDLDFGDSGDDDGGTEASDLPPLPALDIDERQGRSYTISFKPFGELFDTGNEPAMLLRNLQKLGTASITCHTDDLPTLAKLTPEVPHLSWTIELTSEVDESEILSIFEFVEGLCALEIDQVSGTTATESGTVTIPDLDTDPDPVEVEPDLASMPTPTPHNPTETSPEVEAQQAPASLTAVPDPVTSKPDIQTDQPPRTPVRPTAAAEDKPAKTGGGNAAAKSVVRVDLDRIERLVNLVGELVINQAMLSQSLEQSGLSPHSDAMSGLEEFQRLTRDIQDSVMMIRAQPVKSLFQRMSRIVRESSAAVGKDVRLHTFGEATEVDKTVIERLADPLTHMIRNAVDHGLETTEDRIAAGKEAQGRVNLSAAHRSGRVVIEISDDGAGINRPKVLQIAIDKGLIPADSNLSDTEIDNLLFLPGFSTAAVVSDLSGRGVGMDVVRTAIQALGGRITTMSSPGEGTTFSISLPLTLAVLDGMVIEVAEETLVLPLNLVIETLTLAQDDVQMVKPGNNVIEVRSGFVPLFDLGEALGYRPALENFDGAVVLLIAQEDDSQAAFVIDNILDQRQVVIKGLDESFYRAPGIAAATILGDGQIALILDPADLVSSSDQLTKLQSLQEPQGLSA